MVALIKGTKARSIDLLALDGQSYNLEQAVSASGLVVLAFFKVSCPTCQFTLPFLERLHRHFKTVHIWGVSQDDEDASQSFVQQYGLTFPILLDDKLAVTAQYELSTVPTIFRITSGLIIEQTSVGFVRDELLDLNSAIAKRTNQPVVELFHVSDNIPALKPG